MIQMSSHHKSQAGQKAALALVRELVDAGHAVEYDPETNKFTFYGQPSRSTAPGKLPNPRAETLAEVFGANYSTKFAASKVLLAVTTRRAYNRRTPEQEVIDFYLDSVNAHIMARAAETVATFRADKANAKLSFSSMAATAAIYTVLVAHPGAVIEFTCPVVRSVARQVSPEGHWTDENVITFYRELAAKLEGQIGQLKVAR
jgi:hypothetical protein